MWQQLHVEQSEDFDFNGENKPNCDLALLERHFKQKIELSKDNRPLPKAGDRYRHFKTGKIVTVIGISQHTETLEETVVYECEGRIWNRPLDMFMSEVDHKKYPSAKQKYRLEKIEDGKREIEYTRSNGETVIVRCGGILYRLIRFTNWLKKKVNEE